MSIKHIHDAVIRAFLDGKVVRRYYEFTHVDYHLKSSESFPQFNAKDKWEIIPDPVLTKRYRRFIFNDRYGHNVALYIEKHTILPTDISGMKGFVRWVDLDWQQEEV